jgi:hypothetical protein
MHGKEKNEPIEKAPNIAVHPVYAVRPSVVHGKGVFAVRLFLCHAQYRFFIFFHFYFILFNTYVYFSISFIFC